MIPIRFAALRALLGTSAWIAVLAFSARASDYYVSPSGKDSNSGLSPSQAWKTLVKVSAFDFAPGDRVLLEGGATFAGKLYFDAADAGTAAQPLVVTNFGTGRAAIDAGTGSGIYVYDAAGIEVRSIDVRGSGASTNTQDGVFFFVDLGAGVKLAHVVLDDVEVSGFGGAGIQFGSSSPSKSGFRDVVVSNSRSHHNALAGMATWGFFSSSATTWSHENLHVVDCTFHDNPGDPSVTTNHTGDGVYLGDVNGALIEYCEAFGNGALCANPKGGPVGIWTYDSNAVTIQFCESHHNRTGAGSLDGGGFDFDGGTTNSTIQYCYSHDNDGAGFLFAEFSGARAFHGNTLRYNVSENDARAHGVGAITLWNGNGSNGVSNCQIHNNTVFVKPATSSATFAVRFQSPVEQVALRDNLFVTTGGVALISSGSNPGALFQGNDYFSSGSPFTILWNGANYTSLTAWRTATGQEKLLGKAVGRAVDPMLTAAGAGGTIGDPHALSTLAAYRLKSNSPMINGALNLITYFGIDPGPIDFYGTAIPIGSRYDIGANE